MNDLKLELLENFKREFDKACHSRHDIEYEQDEVLSKYRLSGMIDEEIEEYINNDPSNDYGLE